VLASARGLSRLLDMDAPAAGMRGPAGPATPTPVPPLARAAAALQRLALRRASPDPYLTVPTQTSVCPVAQGSRQQRRSGDE
jgi:hypothetical protein